MFKKLFILLSVIFISCSQTVLNVEAEEIIYTIKDASNGFTEIAVFDSYNQANRYYARNLDDYGNLVLYENENVIKMEYGIVEFETNDACTYNVSYLEKNGDEGYLNGCYGVDGLYLASSNNAAKVEFLMSGVIGEISIHDVSLHPFEALGVRLSMYRVEDGYLIHDIKTQLTQDYYSSSIKLDFAPTSLKEGASYYSYDGHYFYDDFYKMVDDVRLGTSMNAENPEATYYNYYEYLPHRSLTNYQYDEIENYFSDVLHFDRKLTSYYDLNRDSANDVVNASQYVGELKSFFEYQYIYGANALMMLSLSMNESAYGKSLLSYTRNNLFGHAAFDSDVERNASRYQSVEASIYSHARYYISDRYSNHLKYTYHGSYFGNKASGMNVMYASDPYWGEKAASNYLQLDESLGLKDYNQYALGIIKEKDKLAIYEDEACTNLLYYVDDLKDFSMILLAEFENAYKVQLDTSLDENHKYHFEENVAYVLKETFETIINPEQIKETEFVTLTFDGAGGLLNQEEVLVMDVKKGDYPVLSDAYKEGYEFIGFEPMLNIATEDQTYTAIYKEIEAIELVNPIAEEIEYLRFYDLQNGRIKVHYKDGTSRYVLIDTDMVTGLDTSKIGLQTIQIQYCGLKLDVEVYISSELDQMRLKADELIQKNIATYQKNNTYNIDELLQIKEMMASLDYIISFDEVRYLDQMLLDYYGEEVAFVLDEEYDLSISGLALTLDIEVEKRLPYFKNTYYAKVGEVSKAKREDVLEVASAYGFEEVLSFSLSFKENSKTQKAQNPFVVQVALESKQDQNLYTVYRLDEDGSVNKCRTTQTDSFVQFLTEKEGDFVLLAMKSNNDYAFEDAYENLHQQNSDEDIHLKFYTYSTLVIFIICDMILITSLKLLKKTKEATWSDYKKSLRKAVSVQEEKQKN